jgi:hypothetical protein
MLKYARTEGYQKYFKDNILSEAWMDRESARYQRVLAGMGLLKK